MSALEALKNGLKYAEPLVHALQLIQRVTGLGGTDAATALGAVNAIVNTLEGGVAADLDPKDVIKELDKLVVGIAGNDAAADKALEDKFK